MSGGDDAWLASDKLEHLAACCAISAALAACASAHKRTRPWHLLCGAAGAILIGALKEIADGMGLLGDRASAKDMAADVLGACLGLTVFSTSSRVLAMLRIRGAHAQAKPNAEV
eukprot:SM000244S08558  [mRNA]  locus=s244:68646:68987:- [translate_table: standard]